jgi:class 3 adenylate cyclase/tetratricopeptide (TPR) repeat protein
MGRTTATILFTDLVGSTELRGRLGEEAADELRRRHDQALAQAVATREGRVVKGLGDGIMATFSGASDAVAAAVAIQRAIDRLNRSGKTPVPVSVRVGLSAGDVTFEDDDVHGTPVIEASRLCAAANGGEILASEGVRWLTRADGPHRFTPTGSLELKGLADPVPAVRVEWEPAAVSSVPLPPLLIGGGQIFVGREAPLERLRQLWKETGAGARRVALLAGEPGVGKTRLAAELAAGVNEEGALVLAGRCDEDLGVPYQPFVEALRHFVDHTPPEHLRERLGRLAGELARLVPELTERLADLPPALRSDPETERYRLFDAVAAWLGASAADDPVLLVLDDLQWAAKPTLLLLRHVLRSSEPVRVLVVATYRDSDIGRGHPMSDFLADLRRQTGVERFPLSGLDTAAVAAFIEAAAGHRLEGEEEEELPRVVWRETEGNPFFVTEVLRHLAESHAVEERNGRWVLTAAVDELGIPQGVRDVVGRRLSHLPDSTNEVLSIASVVGLEFEPAVVGLVSALPEGELFVALESAVRARLVTEVTGARYRFGHALVRAALYEELSGPHRVVLHRKVAEALETVHGRNIDDHLPALAYHWERASALTADTARAVDYAARAGDRALTQLAHDEAVAYYRHALELLELRADVADDGRRLDLLISLGDAQRRAGDAAHRQTLLDAARLAGERQDADALARAALANTRQGFMTHVGRVDDDRVAVLESAVDGFGGGAVRARLLATLALELAFGGDSGRCRRLSDEALAEARRVGDPLTLAHVLAARPYSIALPATVAERGANADELEALASRIGDPVMHAWARFHRYRANMERGALSAAQPDVDALERLAGDLGQPVLRWCAAWVRAAHLGATGRLDEAERFARLAADIGATSGQPDVSIFTAGNEFGIRFEQARFPELHESLAKAVDVGPQNVGLKAMVALVDAEVGRLDEAKIRFELVAASDFADLPVNNVWFVTTTVLALVATRLGDRRRSEALHRLLRPYSDLIAGTPVAWLGSVSQYLGMLATTLGWFDEAGRSFAAAETTHQRIGAPIWLARTRVEWARMLLTRRQPGDTRRASELLHQAVSTARELGVVKVERDAVALLQ